jgi:hypothetical protein
VLALFCCAFALLTVYVMCRSSRAVQSGEPLFSNEPTKVLCGTAPPKNRFYPIRSRLQYGEGYGLPTAVVDPPCSTAGMFATGATKTLRRALYASTRRAPLKESRRRERSDPAQPLITPLLI